MKYQVGFVAVLVAGTVALPIVTETDVITITDFMTPSSTAPSTVTLTSTTFETVSVTAEAPTDSSTGAISDPYMFPTSAAPQISSTALPSSVPFSVVTSSDVSSNSMAPLPGTTTVASPSINNPLDSMPPPAATTTTAAPAPSINNPLDSMTHLPSTTAVASSSTATGNVIVPVTGNPHPFLNSVLGGHSHPAPTAASSTATGDAIIPSTSSAPAVAITPAPSPPNSDNGIMPIVINSTTFTLIS